MSKRLRAPSHPIHAVSDDIILILFSFLHLKDVPQLGRVCRRWKTLISERRIPGERQIILTPVFCDQQLEFYSRQRISCLSVKIAPVLPYDDKRSIVLQQARLMFAFRRLYVGVHHIRITSRQLDTRRMVACMIQLVSEQVTRLFIDTDIYRSYSAAFGDMFSLAFPRLLHLTFGIACRLQDGDFATLGKAGFAPDLASFSCNMDKPRTDAFAVFLRESRRLVTLVCSVKLGSERDDVSEFLRHLRCSASVERFGLRAERINYLYGQPVLTNSHLAEIGPQMTECMFVGLDPESGLSRHGFRVSTTDGVVECRKE